MDNNRPRDDEYDTPGEPLEPLEHVGYEWFNEMYAQWCQYTDDGNPLDSAIENQNLEIIKLLMDSGCHINSYQYSNPITSAAWTGNVDILNYLFDNNAERSSNNDAIACASECGHYEAVKLLLEKGDDANSHNMEGSALEHAKRGGYYNIEKLLIQNGAKNTF